MMDRHAAVSPVSRLNGAGDPWIEESESGMRVRRSIFSDPDVYAREIEKIFNRNWIFLGHETEIPRPGDYVIRPMGSDEVIVWRGTDGEIRAFLNACRHRAMALCRSDVGSARRIVCPYHGWTYDTKGALRTTSFDQHYRTGSFSDWGLTPVGQIDQYRGLIFANWDAHGCPLREHLGGLTSYLDVLFARTPGGMSVIAPPQRWIVETNWKIPPLNFMDAQHALRTHAGPIAIAQKTPGGATPEQMERAADITPSITFPQGHGIASAPYAGHLPEFYDHDPEMVALYRQTLNREQLTQLREAAPGVGTIFPNTSWVQPFISVETDRMPRIALNWRNWQPRGPNAIEVWSWYFAPVEATGSLRAEMHRSAFQTFGVGGTLEEDDSEVWTAITRNLQGAVGRRGYMEFSCGLSEETVKGYRFPGRAYPSLLTEHTQRAFLRRWKRDMESSQGRVG
jgi:phenylpropionate dioxygenase-like ring-hydroxylating dioxygenase large terminal subunit